MTDNSNSHVSITQLILVPSIITLVVTLLRLVGELQHWPTSLFNREPGGMGSIIGITWLAFIFGAYFAVKLARTGEDVPKAGRVIGFALLGAVIFAGGLFAFELNAVVGVVLIAAGGAVPFLGWRKLAKVLLAYGYAARIPVAILMYFAMRGNWGTHYDAFPPGFPQDTPFWTKYIRFAAVPQLVSWITFTLIMGSLFGGIALALARRRKQAAQTEQTA